MLQKIDLKLTDKQHLELEEIAKSRKNRQDHIERANVILLCEKNQSDVQVAKKLNITRPTVKKWRERWKKAQKKLAIIAKLT